MDTIHTKKNITLVYDRLLRYAEFLGFGDMHIKMDIATGLMAIIAIHSTKRGPAIGGCRWLPYPNAEEAFSDALRLAQMMSYKAAACGLPHGGAKSVIIRPPNIKDPVAYFQAFGTFINELGGRYITAVDSGTSAREMDIIASRTSYVTCTTQNYEGDPSALTALGVRRGIEAAVKFKLNKNSLENIHVAIQGAGHVGYYLAKELTTLGAKVSQCDTNFGMLKRCIDEFKVKAVNPTEIYDVECDVFAPCALGAVLNLDTIKRLRAKIVAGSANNQLAHRHHGVLLHERDILYAPDFVINAGGLIHVATIYDHGDKRQANQQILTLYDTMLKIFERAASENHPTSEIAEVIALENLK